MCRAPYRVLRIGNGWGTFHDSPIAQTTGGIGDNPASIPGKGSAIFLHVSARSGETAGCICVSEKGLRRIMAWQGTGGDWIDIRS